jgi:nucleoside-diphosphate-sugar epimerase
MESVLVTGGAGFIGSNITEALLLRGYRVTVLDDLSSGSLENIDRLLPGKQFTFIRGSIFDSGLLRSVMKIYQITAICHQAALPSVTQSVLDPVKTLDTNITGTANLFDIAAEKGCRRVVFASSCAVYGDSPELPKREDMPLKPQSPYAVSKAAKEMLAKTFCGIHNMEIVALRYFNVYGKKQNPASDYAAVIPAFIARALRNEPIPVEGDGLQTRDFVYVDDVVQANLLALSVNNIAGRCFNIASGTSTCILDLAKFILKITGSASALTHGAPRPADIRESRADIWSARRDLGYAPAYDIGRGLEDTVKWFRKECIRAAGPASPHTPRTEAQVAC